MSGEWQDKKWAIAAKLFMLANKRGGYLKASVEELEKVFGQSFTTNLSMFVRLGSAVEYLIASGLADEGSLILDGDSGPFVFLVLKGYWHPEITFDGPKTQISGKLAQELEEILREVKF